MAEISYVEDFLKPWGRLKVDTACFDTELPSGLSQFVSAVAFTELNNVKEARKAQKLGLFKYADLATFLPVWEAEESEHGRVLERLARLDDSSAKLAEMTSWERIREGLLSASLVLARYVPGIDIVFLITGLIGEHQTVDVYAELARRSNPGPQKDLFMELARQEGRHRHFYSEAAKARVEGASFVQIGFARVLLTTFWNPVGVNCLGLAGWKRSFAPMLTDLNFLDKLRSSDQAVDKVPRMGGLRLMGRFLDRQQISV